MTGCLRFVGIIFAILIGFGVVMAVIQKTGESLVLVQPKATVIVTVVVTATPEPVMVAASDLQVAPTETPLPADPTVAPSNTLSPTDTRSPTLTPAPTNTLSPTKTSLPPTSTSVPTITPLPTATPLPTNTPSPTDTPEPLTLRHMVATALSDSNRDVARIAVAEKSIGVISIEWTVNSNLTDNMIRTSARMDAAKLLITIHDFDTEYDMINLVGSFPLVDNFGNSTETKVIWLTYERATVDRINWVDRTYTETTLYNRIYEIADHIKLHPVFEE